VVSAPYLAREKAMFEGVNGFRPRGTARNHLEHIGFVVRIYSVDSLVSNYRKVIHAC
jgi:hypothetical protein